MMEKLIALLDSRVVGEINRHQRGRLTFTYDEAWRKADDTYPLSISMPLAAAEHGPDVVEAFLWGLLPDNEQVLDRWARKYQVSARNAFALISNVGEDCAGAVQFVPPEKVKAVLSGAEDSIEWLDERAIAGRLRTLREDPAAWRLPRDNGQFSLAGAQPKTALLFRDGKWGLPSGRTPTTHILKPPTGQFEGHAENEHICLALAHAFGMPTATSHVSHFLDEVAIVIERYDRIVVGNEIVRVHQEDMCQARGLLPTRKYQNDGGPSIVDIVELLRGYSSKSEEDVQTFIQAVGFNWLIAGTDAHAKNYSLLHTGGSRARLAPLYDIASVLPYKEFDIHKMKLSMKVGGEYQILDVGIRQWQKLARDLRIDADSLIGQLKTMAERMPDEVSTARQRAREKKLQSIIVDRLAHALTERARECNKLLRMG